MNISIIIPNYNGEEIIKKNLPRVFDAVNDYKGGKYEIIVVDDASEDNSLNILGKLGEDIPSLKILRNEKNLGFSSTINKGVKEASGEIIVLLNTDVYPEKDFLKPLIKHFNDEKVFGVGCMDRSIEDGKIVLRGRGIGKFSRGFLIHKKGEVDGSSTLWVSGGSSAFRKETWEKLDGFNELYSPFYWEDIDISYRAQKSGYKIIFENSSVVVHEHSKGAIESYYSRFKIKKIAYRNQFIFVWTNITDLDYQFLHMIWFPYHLLRAILKGDTVFILGFLSALILLPKIIKSSFKYKKLFIKKDREILNSFK